jgi:hypothetical protein
MLFSVLKNILIIFLLIGGLFAITKISPKIKKQADTNISKVLGTKTIAQTSEELPSALKKDATEQLEIAKDQAMKVNLGDIVNSVKRLEKIPKDLQSVQSETLKQLTSWYKSTVK